MMGRNRWSNGLVADTKNRMKKKEESSGRKMPIADLPIRVHFTGCSPRRTARKLSGDGLSSHLFQNHQSYDKIKLMISIISSSRDEHSVTTSGTLCGYFNP